MLRLILWAFWIAKIAFRIVTKTKGWFNWRFKIALTGNLFTGHINKTRKRINKAWERIDKTIKLYAQGVNS